MITLSKLLYFFPVDGSGINQQLSTGNGVFNKLSPFDLLNCAGLHTWFVGAQVLEQKRENTVHHKKAASLLLPTTLY
jgi:hypothetical protein